MKKIILTICIVVLFTNFVSSQSGVDLSNRFNMNGVHIDTSGRAIEVKTTRPEVVRLKNPLVAESNISNNTLLLIKYVISVSVVIFIFMYIKIIKKH